MSCTLVTPLRGTRAARAVQVFPARAGRMTFDVIHGGVLENAGRFAWALRINPSTSGCPVTRQFQARLLYAMCPSND